MIIRKHGRYRVAWLLTLVHNGIDYQGTTQCSDSALRNSGTARTSSPPSVKNRTVW